jgi:hypothetical protein
MKPVNIIRRYATYGRALIVALLFVFGAKVIFEPHAARAALYMPQEPTPAALDEPALSARYQQTITAEGLAARLYFLASDLFEGRETTTRGQKLAARYLASQYRGLGLTAKGTTPPADPLDPAAYFQRFKVYRRQPAETLLEVTANGRRMAASTFSGRSHDDLSYFAFGSLTDAAGGAVFAGYGIKDEALGYDDFAALAAERISVEGKWLIILADEPLRDAGASLLPTPDGKPSKWTTQPQFKRKAVWQAGRPAGVLVVSDAGPRGAGKFEETAARAAKGSQRVGQLSLFPVTPTSFPPTFNISSRMADEILAPSGQTVAGLARRINRSLKPSVFELKGVEVRASVKPAEESLETENVLAFIEGSDPALKEQVVVISSHYDHLGVDAEAQGDQIYNGAADDASGTVASLELARAFMRAKEDGHGPRRSLLFVNFSGEEKGLLGSTFYTEMQPLVPLERIVADINMDGVAGFDPKHPTGSKDYIYVVGSERDSAELMESNRRLNELTGLKLRLDYPPNFSSDQLSFERRFVPFIYFSTGLTEHYHRPSDEPQTIEYNHLARVARLVFANAWQAANQDVPPRGFARGRLASAGGYSCPACGAGCDDLVFEHAGECPVCGMVLLPRVELKDGR